MRHLQGYKNLLVNLEADMHLCEQKNNGALKTTGTEIDKLMPPISRFGGGGRAKKKQGIIEKLKTFFEKYFGLGIVGLKAEETRATGGKEEHAYDR